MVYSPLLLAKTSLITDESIDNILPLEYSIKWIKCAERVRYDLKLRVENGEFNWSRLLIIDIYYWSLILSHWLQISLCRFFFGEKHMAAQVRVALVRRPVDVFSDVKRLALCSVRLHQLFLHIPPTFVHQASEWTN